MPTHLLLDACRAAGVRSGQACLTCGSDISVPRSHRRKYCSKKCQAAGMRLVAGQALRNEVLRGYQRHAAERCLNWNLSDGQVDILFAGDCYWCGQPPAMRRERFRNHGAFIYNGIDRVDNSLPYELGNVVSCCQDCNFMKRDMRAEAFIAKVRAIARRHR